jgi:hypothetical protein
MAKMYPEQLPAGQNISYAEKTLFECFKTRLPDRYSVYHSFHWTSDRNTPREADFVLLDPEAGFMVLEAKGGRIIIEQGDWFTANQRGRHPIENPFSQAQRSMYFLLDHFRQKYKSGFPGKAGYAVCMPDSRSISADAHPELTGTNALFYEDLEEIEDWVATLFEHPYYGAKRSFMDDHAAGQFMEMIQPNIQIPLTIASALHRQQGELRSINLFQDYLLDIFEDKSKAAFQGAAGTGKSWIAFKKAKRLISQGHDVLMLCYNRLLRNRLSELADEQLEKNNRQLLDIYTFHGFANQIFTEYLEILLEDAGEAKNYFAYLSKIVESGEIHSVKGFLGNLNSGNHYNFLARDLYEIEKIPERLLEFTEILLTPSEEGYFNFNVPMALLTILQDPDFDTEKYDAIIIDEGQDFDRSWCDCLGYFLENKRKRIVYLFYDDNQNIFMGKKQLPVIDLISKYNVQPYLYKLRRNLRNTRPIHNFAIEKTGLGSTADSAEIQGIPPVVLHPETPAQARKEVGRILHTLLVEHRVKNEQVVVLTDRSISKSIFSEYRDAGSFKLTETGKGATGKYIRLRSTGRFKGLESDVVILITEPAEESIRENRNELLYVAYTRARFLLYVLELGS